MINLLKVLFGKEAKENAIASRIEIKEMQANNWWS